MSLRPLILLTNDDGIEAEGIRRSAEALASLGELWVCAPRYNQSAVSYAVTINDPIRLSKHTLADTENAYAITGTPADCIKFAMTNLLPRRPDLIVSGINHGPNLAVNLLHSGTVGGAMEGCVDGIPSVAISSLAWSPEDGFSSCKWALQKIATQVLANGLPDGTLLNVNVPYLPIEEIEGFRVTRQARSRWEERFEPRKDPAGRTYYWLTGEHHNLDRGTDTDLAAVEANFVSITPLTLDRTHKAFGEEMQNWVF